MTTSESIRWTAGSVPVARLSGELDLANAADVMGAVRAGVSGNEVVIDLTGVTFMDSSALSQLVALGKAVTVRVVATEGSEPRRVLELTGLTGWLAVFDTLGDAVDHE
jgi:anti-anti-sigma factor